MLRWIACRESVSAMLGQLPKGGTGASELMLDAEKCSWKYRLLCLV